MLYIFRFILLYLLSTFSIHADEWWLENSYLLWTTKKASLAVPLVTSASLDDALPGAIGQPGTKILLGDEKIDLGWRNGYRVSIGRWLECCPDCGVEIGFLVLPNKKYHQSIQTSGEPGSLNLAVPIFDVTGLWGLQGLPGDSVFILPGPLDGPGFQGQFSLKLSSQLLGSEINAKINLKNKSCYNIDCIGGFHWLQLKESLSFEGKTEAVPGSAESGFYNFEDSFKAVNNFYGPQIGLKGEYRIGKLLLNGFAKLALGCMNQGADIKGKSRTSNGNLFYMTKNSGNTILNGGLFSEPGNRGSHYHNQFAAVLETGVSLSFYISTSIEIGLGYNFLWLNQVLRPENEIDRRLNPTQTVLAKVSRESVGVGPATPIPFGEATAASLPIGSERPKFKHRSTDFWAQGLTVTINCVF